MASSPSNSEPGSGASTSSSTGHAGPPEPLPAFLLQASAATAGRAADFEKVSCLGEGAFGAVWLARCREDGQRVALKEVARGRLAGSDTEARRIWEERDCLAAIGSARQEGQRVSPALIGLIESYTTPMALCLVMDLVEGIPVHQLVRGGGALPESNAAWFAAEVAGALAWLNGAGWLYRDLKLSNVVVSAREGRARLVDFGFAKKAARASSVVGTLHTMAPEVVRCKDEEGDSSKGKLDYGLEADWWSLGVFLFEVLVGTSPFGYLEDIHLEGQQLLEAHSRELPWPSPPPSDAARRAVEALLEKGAKSRLSSLESLRDEPFFREVQWSSAASASALGPRLQALDDAWAAQESEPPRRPRHGRATSLPLAPGAQDPFADFGISRQT